MPGGRTKAKITIAIDPVVARALDAWAEARGVSRSAAAEEAVSEWLRRVMEEQGEALDRADGRRSRTGRGEAAEARIAAGMVLQAMRYQFRSLADLTDGDLRRRATGAILAQDEERQRRERG